MNKQTFRVVSMIVAAFWFCTGMQANAQSFSGTNASGAGTLFEFTLDAGATNLSLSLSNTSTAYSQLYLRCGGTASVTNFDQVARLAKTNIALNIELADLHPGSNYSLLVYTPAASAQHAFTAQMSVNRSGFRFLGAPVWKPVEFSVNGSLNAGTTNVFQIDVPTNLPGWRIVLSSSGVADPDLYVHRGAIPTASVHTKRSIDRMLVDTVFLDQREATNHTYFVSVYIPSSDTGNASYTLSAEIQPLALLSWDPGTDPAGLNVVTNPSTLGGDYFFRIVTTNTDCGVWRTRLNVVSGEADLFLKKGTNPPTTSSYDQYSAQSGSDGVALVQAGQFQTNETWSIMVFALPGAQWRLYSGNVFVGTLPPPAGDESSGTNVVIDPEGMNFYRTQLPTNTLAWRLGIGTITNSMLVRTGLAAHPFGSAYYNWKHAGQILLVPPYLRSDLYSYVTLTGQPGQTMALDSRQQPIIELPFDSATNIVVTNYGYVSYRVTVPANQIGWQLDVAATSGDPSVAVRQSAVPNEYFSTAFSENTNVAFETTTLVPPTLTDGSFFVTVYGKPPYSAAFTNARPVVTDVHYAFCVTNDINRLGWRFYRVVDPNEQLGTLGWDLLLENQLPGTEITLRRNYMPGRWNSRTNSGATTTMTVRSNIDYSSIKGFLQRPRQVADVWYIGVNNYTQELGGFVLTGREIPRPDIVLSGSFVTNRVTNQPAGFTKYFKVNVDSNVFAIDLRLINITNGDPELVLCRDILPLDLSSKLSSGGAWSPNASATWASGSQIYHSSDWTGYTMDAQGTNIQGRYFFSGRGNPLEPGTYYVGVMSGSSTNEMEYDLIARALYTNESFANLSFVGSDTKEDVVPREVFWYKVAVPTNAPSWKFHLHMSSGEGMIVFRTNGLPNYGAVYQTPFSLAGCRLKVSTNEHFLLLPTGSATNILGGTYYIGVIGEGQGPSGTKIGSNTCSFSMVSEGSIVPVELGAVDRMGTNMIERAEVQDGAENRVFHFTVPTNTPVIEVRLRDRMGNPRMSLITNTVIPRPYLDTYGYTGGKAPVWTDSSSVGLIRVPNPAPGDYTLTVQAASITGTTYTNTSYTLQIYAQQAEPIHFDSGVSTITNQLNDTWRYFLIEVPSDVLGWDLRLTNITAGDPRMVISRDRFPTALSSSFAPFSVNSWPSNAQFAPTVDWTGYSQSVEGTNQSGQSFVAGMSNPVVAGVYIVGVTAATGAAATNSMSYTIVSRGIGTNYSIPVVPLSFTNGTAYGDRIPVRDALYYSVVIPSNTPSWQLQLHMISGEGMLALRKGGIPNHGVLSTTPITNLAGLKLQKTNDEHFVLLPEMPGSVIQPGTYYIAAISEGTGPSGVKIGGTNSYFSLTSFGTLRTVEVGEAGIFVTNTVLANGAIQAYHFSVSTGAVSLWVDASTSRGNPWMSLRTNGRLPKTHDTYGRQGGWTEDYTSTNHIGISLVPGIASGDYYLLVQATSPSATVNPDATFRLSIRGMVPGGGGSDMAELPFDGGFTNSMTYSNASGSTSLDYYYVVVPTNAMGWELRITNVSLYGNGDPQMIIRRGTYPDGFVSKHSDNTLWSTWGSSSNWPYGSQIAPLMDWTGYSKNAAGISQTGKVFSVGMGNPLEPGTYIIAIGNALPNSFGGRSYTISSRGIGPGFSIPVTAVSNGVVTVGTNLSGIAETAYFSFDVPVETPLWKLKLVSTNSESMMVIQRGLLPNITAKSNHLAATLNSGGHLFQKPENEHAYFGSPTGFTNELAAGTYYVAVISEGLSPSYTNNSLGTNVSWGFTLSSSLPNAPTDLGVLDYTAGDVLYTNSLDVGETETIEFSVPSDTLLMAVMLENYTGNPVMRLRNDGLQPLQNANYGQDGSYAAQWQATNRIVLKSPTNGLYALTVQSVPTNGVNTNLDFTLRIHAEGPAPIVAFDAGSLRVTNQPVDFWKWFKIIVPSNAVGWDVRLVNVSNGSPRMVIARDEVPDDMTTKPELFSMTNWPAGYQVVPGVDWTALNDPNGLSQTGRVFTVGMGNPLEAGVYYVGVTNTTGSVTMTYSILSRGIGTGYSIPVTDLPFSGGSVSHSALTGRECAWYRVSVPSNCMSWKMDLSMNAGDALLMAQKDYLPNPSATNANAIAKVAGGKKVSKTGDEHLMLMAGSTLSPSNLLAGVYYLGVVSLGQNPDYTLMRMGTNTVSFQLFSSGEFPPQDLGVVGSSSNLLAQGALEGGEIKTWAFSIPSGIPAIEIGLEETNGFPAMTLAYGSLPPAATNSQYGIDGGVAPQLPAASFVTIPNPPQTNCNLTVQAASRAGVFTNSSFKVRVRQMPIQTVNFDAALNGNGYSNTTTAILEDGHRMFFQVVVPGSVGGQDVIGWKLNLSSQYGTPSMRVRKNALPDDLPGSGTSTNYARQAVLVPEYLSPGTWYVEVVAAGLTSFTLTSSTLDLTRPSWNMPVAGQPVTTPGLPTAGPLFGDTGVETNGVDLSSDQGVNLEQDSLHYYAVEVPNGNIGLMRCQLDAISGNPNMYLRYSAPPTLSHNASGAGGPLYNRCLTNSVGTEYANWAAFNGRSDTCLAPGTYYIAVHAAGGSNVRYRLRLSTGNITDLAFNGGVLTNQSLAAGDWRYYCVQLPTNMTTRWTFTFTKLVGDVVMHVRDTIPPGQGTYVGNYLDWAVDLKNHGPYGASNVPGPVVLSVPPLRPGNLYYIGFRATNDATFNVSSAQGATDVPLDAVLPFVGGAITSSIPANGTLRLRVDVPSDARRWIHSSTHPSSVKMYIDQGSTPTVTAADHWSGSGANSSLNTVLYNSSWPWLPGNMYYVTVTNTSSSVQTFSLRMDGRDCETDDYDSDGLPDCWEIAYFGDIWSYGPDSDPDNDGFSNLVEYQRGTSPIVADNWSVNPPSIDGGGNFALSINGPTNCNYRVLASQTLETGSWVQITNIFLSSPSQVILIPIQPDDGGRFFRIVTP